MNSTISVDALLQTIQTLSLAQKRELQEHLEQQIFEAEEAAYIEDEATRQEIAAVQTEYAEVDSMTFDEYLKGRKAIGTRPGDAVFG